MKPKSHTNGNQTHTDIPSGIPFAPRAHESFTPLQKIHPDHSFAAGLMRIADTAERISARKSGTNER